MSERHPRSRSYQLDRRWSLLALLLIFVEVVVLAVAVQLTPGSTGAGPSGSTSAMSPYEQLFARVQPDGSVDKETALEAFALAIAPLPGVTPPSGAPTPYYERMDGTFAINWIRPYLDQLTPDQQSVVSAALTPAQNVPVLPAGSSASRFIEAMAVTADASNISADNAILANAQTDESKALGAAGASLTFKYGLVINTVQIDKNGQQNASDTSGAYTLVGTYDLGGGKIVPYCEFHVNPYLVSLSGANPSFTNASLAHEMWHCFQYAHNPGAYKADASWIIEGEAEWVGEYIAGMTAIGAGWWENYLDSPEFSLYARTYSAVGFYLHLAEEGVNPFGVVFAMLDAGGNDAAFTASGATSNKFLDTWSSGLFRDAALGPAWYATGFSDDLISQAISLGFVATPTQSVEEQLDVGPNELHAVNAYDVTNTLYNLTPEADVITIQINGHARLKFAQADEVGLESRAYCTRQEGCTCPNGGAWTGPSDMEYMPAGEPAELALTGGLDGASGSVWGHSISEYCPPATPGPGQPGTCKTECPDSNGDPHLRTTNDYRYDFQAAGEFVLLRNADDSIDIQGREQPYAGSNSVAINTALAVRDNGHRVAVYFEAGGRSLTVKVDGTDVDVATPDDLGAGASVRSFDKGIEILLPDGTIVWALSVGEWGINALIQPSDELRAIGRGLLGPVVPGNLGVPALPDGTLLPAAPDAHTRFTQVYGPFADAWRVTDATSLFDYAAGESTATYTDRSFPSEASQAALASLDPAAEAAAEAACSSVTDPELGPECIFDVAATGDTGFAQQYASQQDLYDTGIAPATPVATANAASPTPGNVVNGAVRITDLEALGPTTMGDNDTMYAEIQPSSGSATEQLIAIDAQKGTILASAAVATPTKLAYAAGSLWVTDLPGAVASGCSVTRLDAGSLAQQAVVAVPCSPFGQAEVVSDGAALWVTDYSNLDLSTNQGVVLRRIDPTSNAVQPGIALPGTFGQYFESSVGALFYWNPNTFLYRLNEGATTWNDFGNPGSFGDPLPAGSGVWLVAPGGEQADLYADPGSPTATVALAGGVVAADEQAVYVDAPGPAATDYLLRVPADGSAAIPLATAPTIDSQELFYFGDSVTKYVTADGLVAMWVLGSTSGSGFTAYLQWAPLQ